MPPRRATVRRVSSMTPEALAALHASAFDGQARGWSADEFAQLLSSDTVFVVGDADAFAMGRVVADEAELLTLARAPKVKGQCYGIKVLFAFEWFAEQRGARRFFLEVAEDNAAAIRLYLGAGYGEIARRKAYYKRPDGCRADALILEKRSA